MKSTIKSRLIIVGIFTAIIFTLASDIIVAQFGERRRTAIVVSTATHEKDEEAASQQKIYSNYIDYPKPTANNDHNIYNYSCNNIYDYSSTYYPNDKWSFTNRYSSHFTSARLYDFVSR